METNQNFKIKLIFPCKLRIFEEIPSCGLPTFYLPYGMGVITAFLRQKNFSVDQEDLRFKAHRSFHGSLLSFVPGEKLHAEAFSILASGVYEGPLGSFIDKILAQISSLDSFQLIGFSILSYESFIAALLLAKRIKQRINTPIIFGGPFLVYGHLYPEIFDYVDYAIIGDGGAPLLRLTEHLRGDVQLADVPNLMYQKEGKAVFNPRVHYPVEDMPAPDFDGLDLRCYSHGGKKEELFLPYQITKGCAGHCSFCSYRLFEQKIEFKSLDKVLGELKFMKKKYDSSEFIFSDSSIGNSLPYLEKFCDALIESNIRIHWLANVKIGNLDLGILRKMRRAGCSSLYYGIESGSDSILRRMGKPHTAQEAQNVLRNASEAGIKNGIFLIVGFPHEKIDDVRETGNFIRTNRRYISAIVFYMYILCRGSLVYDHPEKYGITKLKPMKNARFVSAFDEVGGMAWEEMLLRRTCSLRQLRKAYTVMAYMPLWLEKPLSGFIRDIKMLCVLRKRTLAFWRRRLGYDSERIL